MVKDIKTFGGIRFCNTYLFSMGGDMAVIDPGEIPQELINHIDNLKYILLTHDHFDHIMKLGELKSRFPKAQIVVHKNDISGLSDNTVNQGKLFGYEVEYETPDITVEGGEELPFANTSISVIHTPGHTDGSVCYLCDDVLFSGDTLFCGSIGRTDFNTGSMTDMLNSLSKLKKLDSGTHVYPGHGEATSIGTEKNHNPYFSL